MIDPVIREWAKKHQLKLFESMAGFGEIRCAYMSSPRGECFQIYVDRPKSGQVTVHAADVETADDEEFRSERHVPVAELSVALEDALGEVQRWMVR